MAAVIKSVTFDCADALMLDRFWAAALGTDLDEDTRAERAYVQAAGWAGRSAGNGFCVLRALRPDELADPASLPEA